MENEQLRKLQETELGILEVVAELCERHGIKYYLDSGTLIGAIRHNGFIPWDDDIDTAMPYSDYVRFLEIAQKELGDGYFVQNYLTEENFCRSYTKVRLRGTTVMPLEWKNWNIFHGAWIDIFPMFYADSDREFRWKQFLFVMSGGLQAQDFYRNYLLQNKKTPRSLLKYYLVALVGIIPIRTRQRIHKRILDYVFSKKDGRYLCRCEYAVRKFETDWYMGSDCYHQFEHLSLRIPNNYDKVLREDYGDYMQIPPENERGNHGELEISI